MAIDSDNEEEEEEEDTRKKPDYVSSGQLKADLMNDLLDSSSLPSAGVLKADRLRLDAALTGNRGCQTRWSVLQTQDKSQNFQFVKKLFHENVRKYIERDKKTDKLLVDVENDKRAKHGNVVKPIVANRPISKPIIIVPSALSALINGSNIESFLMTHKYAPVDSTRVIHRQNIPRVYPHPITQEAVEYNIKVIDNPTFDDGSLNRALSDEEWDCGKFASSLSDMSLIVTITLMINILMQISLPALSIHICSSLSISISFPHCNNNNNHNHYHKICDNSNNVVVAVFVTGQAWQFKGWKWDNPTYLFQNVLGVHICFNDTAPHANIAKWNCKVLKIGRYERHQDTVVVNKFWEMFDEFARVNNKPVVKKHRAEDYQ